MAIGQPFENVTWYKMIINYWAHGEQIVMQGVLCLKEREIPLIVNNLVNRYFPQTVLCRITTPHLYQISKNNSLK